MAVVDRCGVLRHDLDDLWHSQKSSSTKRGNEGSFLPISTNVFYFPTAILPRNSDQAMNLYNNFSDDDRR